MTTDRRAMIQKVLDQIEPGWVIWDPVRSGDIEGLCIFQKPDEYKEARAYLPRRWFDDDEQHQIQLEIQRAVSQAVVTQ